MRNIRNVISAAVLATALTIPSLCAPNQADSELLRVRESVWRAFFAGDVKTLEQLVPAETVVISSDANWEHRADVLRESAEFHSGGGKLVRLEFPRTEVQHFGDVAVTYSQYLYETEKNGKRSITSGRVTEIFVRHNGQWTNPGWHTDQAK